jgi:hypothetical protein
MMTVVPPMRAATTACIYKHLLIRSNGSFIKDST